MSQRLSVEKTLRTPETTCENILSTDPDALTQAKFASALALVFFGHDICTSCEGAGRATKHANHKHDT